MLERPSGQLTNRDHPLITNTTNVVKHTTNVVRYTTNVVKHTTNVVFNKMTRDPYGDHNHDQYLVPNSAMAFLPSLTMQSLQLSVQFLSFVDSWWDLLRGVLNRGRGYR